MSQKLQLSESSSDREKIGSKKNGKQKGERTAIFKMYKNLREYAAKQTMQSPKFYSSTVVQ